LNQGDLYQFRITARNIIGDSTPSESLELMAATLPGKPISISRKISDETSITIQWSEPADNGGTPITDYQILWDEGLGGSFVNLGSTLNQQEFTPEEDLITGDTYRFKIKAVNYMGTGSESDVISLISASVPDAPEKPFLYQATQN
jgi:hypothetical protein